MRLRILSTLMLVFGLSLSCGLAEEPASPGGDATPSDPNMQRDATAESDEQADERYVTKEEHDPNGTGKFYMGREIARVMSWHGAPWLERESREQEERLSLLIRSLGLKNGDVVADIGAGSGVISVLLADVVAPEGTVLAVDIQKEMLELLKAKTTELGVKNVKPVLGTVDDPKLPEAGVDLALMVDVYHEFEFPYEMTAALAKSLKPGGRLVWVEYRKEDPRVPIKLVHKMSEAQVKREASLPEFGLKYQKTIDALPRQHVIIFTKQADDAAEKK